MRSVYSKLFIFMFSFCVYITPTISAGENAKYSKYFGILDLRMMDEREHDPHRDKTITAKFWNN